MVLRTATFSLFVVSMVVMVSGCGGDGDGMSSDGPVKVGLSAPLTGDFESIGTGIVQAARLAEREVNAAGGLLGRQVEVVAEDDNFDPEIGREAVRRMIEEEDVVAITGPGGSEIMLEQAPLVTEAMVPLVSFGATSNEITDLQPANDRWLFRTVPPDSLIVKAILNVVDQAGCQQLGIVNVDDAFGNGLGDALDEQFSGNVAGRVKLQMGRADYADKAQMLANQGPDCITLVTFAETGGTFLRDWSNLSDAPEVDWFGGDAFNTDSFLEAAGDPARADGFKGVTFAQSTDRQAYNTFASNYQSTYGEEHRFQGAYAFDAMALNLLAIARAGVENGMAVRDALYEISRPNESNSDPVYTPGELDQALIDLREGRDINYQGASGPCDFDEFGNVVAPYEVYRYDHDMEKFVVDRIIQPSELQE